MPKSQIDSAALLAVLVAGALALMLLPGPFFWLASIGGLSLLFVLLAYDREGYRTVFQSLAFSAVFAFCVMLASAAVLRLIAASNGEAHPEQGMFSTQWLPLIWAILTAIFCPIDRARMSGRVAPGSDVARGPVQGGFVYSPQYEPPVAVATATPAPAPPPQQPLPQPVVQAQRRPLWAADANSAPAQRPQPASVVEPAPQPAYQAQQVAYQAPQVQYQAPQTTRPTFEATSLFQVPQEFTPQPPAPQPAAPPNAVLVRGGGKEVEIYISLVGEGLNLMRSVKAEHMGRDYYKIVENAPPGETWEFATGQVVRCEKRKLSTGKGLVAVEEAPRAR